MKNKRLGIIFSIVALLLLVPLVSMQFTDEVNWSALDFVVAGGLLILLGLGLDALARKIQERKFKLLAIAGTLVLFTLIWIELAVGVFGSPIAGS